MSCADGAHISDRNGFLVTEDSWAEVCAWVESLGQLVLGSSRR